MSARAGVAVTVIGRALVLVLALGPLGGCRFLARRIAGCGHSAECREAGRCGVRTYRAGDAGLRCVVSDDASCRRSARCARDGACRFAPEVDPAACVALTPADCLASAGCREEGRCQVAADGRCVASETGCQRSAACAREERCALRGERCGRSFADAPSWCVRACREEGACTRQGRECRAGSDGDCRASLACRRDGRCSLDPATGQCVARADADCRASSACAAGTSREARCALRGAICADPRPACARSDECLLRGDCQARDGMCVPVSRDDCAPSIECLVEGRCTPGGHLCLVRDEAECRRSLECRAYGRCQRRRFLGMSWCVAPGGDRAAPPRCPRAACLAEGRCLAAAPGACQTPAEAGLDARLPTRPPPAPPAPPPPPPPAPSVDGSRLRARVDGTAVTFTHAVAATRGGGRAVHVVLADGPVGCDLARDAAPAVAPTAAHVVRLVIAPLLIDRPPRKAPPRRLPDGATAALGVTHAAWPTLDPRRGSASYGSLAGWAGAAGGLGAEGTVVSLSLSVSAHLQRRSLVLSGTIPVRGCGAGPAPVPALPQPRVTFQVEGQAVPVRGALVRHHFAHPEVWLTSEPTTCRLGDSLAGPPADVLARVTLAGDGRADLTLGGATLPQQIGVFAPHGRAHFVTREDGDGEVEVALDFAPAGANPRVLLRGTARALRCR